MLTALLAGFASVAASMGAAQERAESRSEPTERRQTAVLAGVPSLSDLVQRSERIVVGSIARVRRVRVEATYAGCAGPSTVEIAIAELDVKQTWWGAHESRTVSVVLPDIPGDALHGERPTSVWFLRHSAPPRSSDRATREYIEGLTRSCTIQRAVDGDRGRLPIVQQDDGAIASVDARQVSLPKTGELPRIDDPASAADRCAVRLPDLEAWIRRTIDADTPRVTAEIESSGPCAFRVRIEPDGSLFTIECGPEQAHGRAESSLQRIIATCERERLFDLPCVVGHDLTRRDDVGCPIPPPSDGRRSNATRAVVRIRTSIGAYEVVIGVPPDRKREPDSDVDAYDRALRIWNTIPSARGWKLPAR